MSIVKEYILTIEAESNADYEELAEIITKVLKNMWGVHNVILHEVKDYEKTEVSLEEIEKVVDFWNEDDKTMNYYSNRPWREYRKGFAQSIYKLMEG